MVRLVQIAKAVRILSAALVLFVQFGCSKKAADTSTVILQFTDNSSSSQKVGSLSVGLQDACFIANIKGEGIISSKAGSCDVEVGVFGGSVDKNGTLTLTVPRGNSRKLEIYAYFRASTAVPCPALDKGFGNLDRTLVAKVGENPSFNIDQPEVTVPVTVSAPAAGVNVGTQFSMPATCIASNTTTPKSTRGISAGGGRLMSTSFVLDGRINGVQKEARLSSTSHRLQMSQQE